MSTDAKVIKNGINNNVQIFVFHSEEKMSSRKIGSKIWQIFPTFIGNYRLVYLICSFN